MNIAAKSDRREKTENPRKPKLITWFTCQFFLSWSEDSMLLESIHTVQVNKLIVKLKLKAQNQYYTIEEQHD